MEQATWAKQVGQAVVAMIAAFVAEKTTVDYNNVNC